MAASLWALRPAVHLTPDAKMLIAILSLLFLLLATPGSTDTTKQPKESPPPPLMLSPYLRDYWGPREARTQSKVDFFMDKAGVEAYSGYITVQEKSHLFFLFLKAPKNITDKAPLILWLQGGPGKSALFAQFLENGPLGIDAQGELYNRTCSFQKFANVLYVDYPAGGGYSIIESRDVLSKLLMHVTDDLEHFLWQFYRLFPEAYSMPLYVVGESYGARAAVSLAKRLRIHISQQQYLQKVKNYPLSGVILSAGFFVPLQQSVLKSEEYLYQLGLVDSKGRDNLTARFQKIKKLSKRNKTEAIMLLAKTALNMNISGNRSLFSTLTGYSYQSSILYTTQPEQIERYIDFVSNETFKKALHINPNATLDGHRLALSIALAPNDFFNNITSILQQVLNTERVLIMNGQMDAVFPPATFEKYMQSLEWQGSRVFRSAERKPWLTRPQCEMAGYVTETARLVYALVLRAGHYIALDMCDAAYDLVNRFVKNITFS